MRKWAAVVIGLYALIIAGIVAALGLLAVTDVEGELVLMIGIAWVAVMTLCQAGLLVVPIRLHGRRPVTRLHLLWPILVAIFSCLAMTTGMFLVGTESLKALDIDWGGHQLPVFIAILGIWAAYTFLFGFYTGRRDPATFMGRTVRFLLAGSILELLVAVPVHVLARSKDYCSAGYLSVWGLGLGLSVMRNTSPVCNI